MQAPDGGPAQHWEVRVAGPEQHCDQLCRPLSTKPEFTLEWDELWPEEQDFILKDLSIMEHLLEGQKWKLGDQLGGS